MGTTPKKESKVCKLHIPEVYVINFRRAIHAFQKRRILDSDEEDSKDQKSPAKGKQKPNLSKLKEKTKGKPVDIANAFGKSPVKRLERESKKPVVSVEIPSDDEFEKSIVNMEEDGPKNTTPRKSHRGKETKSEKTTPKKTPTTVKRERSPVASKRKSPAQKSPAKPKAEAPPKTPIDKKPTSSAKKSTKKESSVDLETSVQLDEERHERRQMTVALYQKYKNRAAVLNHGCKEIPKGKPNCLAGKIFLVTGVLESMERGEAEDLIKEYGGKISSGVTKKLNYMVAGEEAGPSKLTKATEQGVSIISEDDLLDMIRGGPGKRESSGEAVPKKEKSSSPEKKKSPEKKQKSPEKKQISPEKKRVIKGEPKDEEFQTFNVKKKLKIEPEDEQEVKPGPSTAKEEKNTIVDDKNLAWVDKYKPTSIKNIIGQQGPSSNTNKFVLMSILFRQFNRF